MGPVCCAHNAPRQRWHRANGPAASLQEGLLQEARALQQNSRYDQDRQSQIMADHPLARLMQLGVRTAGYFGCAKTKFQLHLAAIMANLTLLAD